MSPPTDNTKTTPLKRAWWQFTKHASWENLFSVLRIVYGSPHTRLASVFAGFAVVTVASPWWLPFGCYVLSKIDPQFTSCPTIVGWEALIVAIVLIGSAVATFWIGEHYRAPRTPTPKIGETNITFRDGSTFRSAAHDVATAYKIRVEFEGLSPSELSEPIGHGATVSMLTAKQGLEALVDWVEPGSMRRYEVTEQGASATIRVK